MYMYKKNERIQTLEQNGKGRLEEEVKSIQTTLLKADFNVLFVPMILFRTSRDLAQLKSNKMRPELMQVAIERYYKIIPSSYFTPPPPCPYPNWAEYSTNYC